MTENDLNAAEIGDFIDVLRRGWHDFPSFMAVGDTAWHNFREFIQASAQS